MNETRRSKKKDAKEEPGQVQDHPSLLDIMLLP